MKRFIYSGCSFTNYAFPTWADIIAYDKIKRGEIEAAYNLAMGGACNHYIFSSLLMAKSKLDINSEDLVGIGWSTIWRHSLIDPDTVQWQTLGSLFHNLSWNKLDNHFDIVNNDLYLLQRTVTAYESAHALFDIDFEIKLPYFEAGVDTITELFDSIPYTADVTLINYLRENIDKFLAIPNFEIANNESVDMSNTAFFGHPTLQEHLTMAQSQTELLDSTVKEVSELHNDMMEVVNQPNKDLETIQQELNDNFFCNRYKEYGDSNVWSMIFSYADARYDHDYFLNC